MAKLDANKLLIQLGRKDLDEEQLAELISKIKPTVLEVVNSENIPNAKKADVIRSFQKLLSDIEGEKRAEQEKVKRALTDFKNNKRKLNTYQQHD